MKYMMSFFKKNDGKRISRQKPGPRFSSKELDIKKRRINIDNILLLKKNQTFF